MPRKDSARFDLQIGELKRKLVFFCSGGVIDGHLSHCPALYAASADGGAPGSSTESYPLYWNATQWSKAQTYSPRRVL
jgi:hypothetical protein